MRQQGIKNKVRMGKLPRRKRYYHWLQQTTYCVNMLDFYFVVSFFFRVHWEFLPHVKNIFSHTRKKIPSSSTVLQGHADACLLWMVPCSHKKKSPEQQKLSSMTGNCHNQCIDKLLVLGNTGIWATRDEMSQRIGRFLWGHELLLSGEKAQCALKRTTMRGAWDF